MYMNKGNRWNLLKEGSQRLSAEERRLNRLLHDLSLLHLEDKSCGRQWWNFGEPETGSWTSSPLKIEKN